MGWKQLLWSVQKTPQQHVSFALHYHAVTAQTLLVSVVQLTGQTELPTTEF